MKAMWRKVCQEAGGRIIQPDLLRELNLGTVLPGDNSRLECLVDELPVHNAAQLGEDCTLVSPLTRRDEPRSRADKEDGAAIADSQTRKERRYPELCQGNRCILVVTGMKVGGQ